MEPARRNIELKARIASLDEGRQIARGVATDHLGVQKQVDTYFCCRQGRLKLRESDQTGAQLVSYLRADSPDAKPSDYRLLDISDPQRLRAMLAETLGVACVVEKNREVFMFENVRIHLDDVVALGTFLEFEAVLSEKISDQQGHDQIAHLSEIFKIGPADLLRGSYSDLIDCQNKIRTLGDDPAQQGDFAR